MFLGFFFFFFLDFFFFFFSTSNSQHRETQIKIKKKDPEIVLTESPYLPKNIVVFGFSYCACASKPYQYRYIHRAVF